MSVIISPSILSADFSCLGEEVKSIVKAGADWIHLDVMDGHFVPNITFGPPIIKAIRSTTDAVFDTHLMMDNPDQYIEAFASAGADIITVHQEACTHLDRTLSQIRSLGKKSGVSLNPATPLSSLENVLDKIDLILIMSVNPGFGGQLFIPQSLNKISNLRKMIGSRPIEIEVDGGINSENCSKVIDAGATAIVAGTAIFGSKNYSAAIKSLRGS